MKYDQALDDMLGQDAVNAAVEAFEREYKAAAVLDHFNGVHAGVHAGIRAAIIAARRTATTGKPETSALETLAENFRASMRELECYASSIEERIEQINENFAGHDNHFEVIYRHLGVDFSGEDRVHFRESEKRLSLVSNTDADVAETEQ